MARFTHPAMGDGSGISILSPYYGYFYSTQTQTAASDLQVKEITFNNTDMSNGVSMVDGDMITMAHSGKYNIQFSAQMNKTVGGSQQSEINIWLKKNGILAANNVPATDSRFIVENDFRYVIGTVNFFVEAAANDFYVLAWRPQTTHGRLLYEAANEVHPSIPSVILSVNQIG